jgi:phosphoribosylformylglycinamidine (FGAM) synthase-like enzyme
MDRLAAASRVVRACHDLSEGGIGVAAAEMAFAGGLGAEVNLGPVPLGEPIDRDDFILFSESNSRFLVEVAPENTAEFENLMAGVIMAKIGQTTDSGILMVYGVNGQPVVNRAISELKEAWQRPLRW